MLEVTEEHEMAWSMKISGNYKARYNYSLTHDPLSTPMGWTIYSVERFYAAVGRV